MRSHWNFSCAVLALVLAACSGGGGGGAKRFTSFSNVVPDKTYEMQASTKVADYTADLNDGTISVGASESKDANYKLSLDNLGDFTKAKLSIAPGPGFGTPTAINFDTANGDSFDDGAMFDAIASDYIVAESANLHRIAVISDHSDMGFEYQSFGVWLTGVDTGSGSVAAMTAGALTPSAQVPANGLATYNGASTGFYVDADGVPFLAFADFTASVDFTAPAQIDVLATNTQVYDMNNLVAGPNAALDYAGSGAVAADGTFNAAITAAADLAGNMDGLLYGPTANELGAVFEMSGPDGRYIGAVGASQ